MPRTDSVSPGAVALRLAGYVKSPSFWVTQEQYELIVYMARQNLHEINMIRSRYGLPPLSGQVPNLGGHSDET